MAGPNLTVHSQIIPLMDQSDTMPYTAANPEKATQNFKQGTPVQLNGGFTQAWDGTTLAAGLLGIALQMGQNLPSNGYGAPIPFGQIQGSQAIQTYGNVPYQPNAVNIALGAPMSDGRTLYTQCSPDVIFEGQCDASSGTVASNWTPTQAMVGTQAGLTIDANGFWYVDLSKTTPGTNTVLVIVGLSPVDGSIANGRVRFQFLAAAQQFPA
jgi:hypothetical protein